MYIARLKLKNFRNYDSLDINFDKRFNVIYGDNAQGKTNIIEAVFLCAFGKSNRTTRDIELIKFGSRELYVNASIETKNLPIGIEIVYNYEKKKKIKINQISVRKIGELIGKLNAVFFSPDDLIIIKGGPAERRRFVDMALSQLKPSYFFNLQQYAKVLAQRNTLLKNMKNERGLVSTIEIWNENLAEIGTKIIKERILFSKVVEKYAKKNHSILSTGLEELEFVYRPSFKVEEKDNEKNIKEEFIRCLEKNIIHEMNQCITMYGPQRDDYTIKINNNDVRNYGSQGQQKTAMLSLKLSEIDIMKEATNESPVLLLDDVMSELDKNRQKYLLETLKEEQIFITCTDRSSIEKIIDIEGKFFKVKNGIVKEE